MPARLPERPPEWAGMPTTELGTHIWGADEASEITDAEPRPKTRRSTTRAPAAPAGSLPELEKRLAAEFRVRQEQSTMERRALVEGISSALEDLRVEFEQRLDETLRVQVGAIETRLSETLQSDRSTIRELAKVLKAVAEVKRSIEAIPLADLRKDVAKAKEVAQDGTRSARAEERRIDRLTKAVDELRTEVRTARSDDGELRRLDDTVRAEVGAIEARLTEVLHADRSTTRDLDKFAESMADLKRSIEAIPLADLRKDVAKAKEVAQDGTRTARAEERRIDRLTKAVDALRSEVRTTSSDDAELQRLTKAVAALQPGARSSTSQARLAKAVDALRADVQAGFTGKADVKDLRAAVNLQRRQEKATSEVRARLDELSKQLQAVGKPRTAPRLSKDLEALERRVRSLEQAVPRKITAALNRTLGPLEEWLGEAIEEIRARVEALDPERLRALVESLEGSAGRAPGPDQPRRRFRRARG